MRKGASPEFWECVGRWSLKVSSLRASEVRDFLPIASLWDHRAQKNIVGIRRAKRNAESSSATPRVSQYPGSCSAQGNMSETEWGGEALHREEELEAVLSHRTYTF